MAGLSFPDEEREEAEGAARELHAELAEVGVVLDDIELRGPCHEIHHGTYKVSLGNLAPEEVRAFTEAVRKLKQKSHPGGTK
ncbi:hypothetical protein [Streptomyces boncukensis]|uniref:Uncharacterized protein n=1 Tax=Streptomyces boncukensis TaxID=2711219 RepID=A0A6G4X7I4_9ACTN|nr:hypothetical protein [Streptomyces boncukensis]NGO72810.1 hypothetical protein [Streptomyces boncukensis]